MVLTQGSRWRSSLERFGAQVEAQVNKDIQHHRFASAYVAGNLKSELEPAIDFTSAVYQLGTFGMRHSNAYKTMLRNFTTFISTRITEDQATAILMRFNI